MLKSLRPVVLTLILVAFGQAQEASTTMSPIEVVAGKPITITMTINKVPSIPGPQIGATLAPRDATNNASPFGVSFRATGEPKVFTATVNVPENAKGVWFLQSANINVGGSGVPIETDHPEVKVRPIEVVLPTKAKAVISVP